MGLVVGISRGTQQKAAEAIVVEGILAEPSVVEGCFLELLWLPGCGIPQGIHRTIAADMLVEGWFVEPSVFDGCFLGFV